MRLPSPTGKPNASRISPPASTLTEAVYLDGRMLKKQVGQAIRIRKGGIADFAGYGRYSPLSMVTLCDIQHVSESYPSFLISGFSSVF